MARRAACVLLTVLAVATTSTACSGSEIVEAGDVRVLVGEGSREAMDARLSGRLVVVDDCLGVERREGAHRSVVVWPNGTEVVDADPLTIDVPDEGEYALGDEIDVDGGNVSGTEVGGVTLPSSCRGDGAWLAS